MLYFIPKLRRVNVDVIYNYVTNLKLMMCYGTEPTRLSNNMSKNLKGDFSITPR